MPVLKSVGAGAITRDTTGNWPHDFIGDVVTSGYVHQTWTNQAEDTYRLTFRALFF